MNTYTRFAAALPLILGLLTTGCGVAPGAGSAIPPVPLAGTRWALTQLTGQTDTGPAITLNLEDARLGGSDGCNSYGGGYTLNGGKLTVDKNLVSTMMACPEPEGGMDQEMQYLAALATAATYTVEGNRMELRTADGALAVSFQAGIAEAAGAVGDAEAGMAGMASVSGTVTYLPRIALPPDALVTVTVHNAQLADAPPEMTTLATTAFTTDGAQVPLPYEVFYSTGDVQEGALYSIGATIRSSAGDLLFTSKEVIPVITKGNPTADVEILVSQP